MNTVKSLVEYAQNRGADIEHEINVDLDDSDWRLEEGQIARVMLETAIKEGRIRIKHRMSIQSLLERLWSCWSLWTDTCATREIL